MHLSDELLSAYFDGELGSSEAMAAAAHLRACAGCAENARFYASLDEQLTATPALACSAALTLVSAQLDGELAGAEATVAAAHLASCAACRNDVLHWSVADRTLAALPLSRPSSRVDRAIGALGRRPAGRARRIAWSAPALAVAMAIAVVVSSSLRTG